MTRTNERGIAMITTLLVMMLISALLVGFTTIIMSDQRYRFIDKDRSAAFYGATAGIEKLTADLGTLFLQNVAPTNAQITALTATASQPVISGVTYTAIAAPGPLPASEVSTTDCYTGGTPSVNRGLVTVGNNGYTISFCANTANNNPTTLAESKTITQGSYAGLYALKTPYQIDVTAKTSSGGEAHLVRLMETVSIPVFQFGIFSDVDQAFHSGDNFAFGGRVHTNGNLYLSVDSTHTLTMSDKVTAYKDVIRQVLPNGVSITASPAHTGVVSIIKGNGGYRTLLATEGSLTGGPGSANYSNWPNVVSYYYGDLKNGANGNAQLSTGAKQLTLPIVAPGVGGTNVDILRRPLPGESTTSILYGERMFNKASIRVMLSDTTTDITNIPGIDLSAGPKSLEAGQSYGGIPIATPAAPGAWAGSNTINGAVTTGNSQTITLSGGWPSSLNFPNKMIASSNGGTKTWSVQNCTQKTLTTFTGCSVAVLTGGTTTIPINATLAGDPTGSPLLPVNISAITTATTSTGSNKTVTVNTTLNFSPNTFWIDDQRVTCTGVTYGGNTLSGCVVNVAIASGEKLDVSYRTTPLLTSTIGGYIKVERLNAADSTWHDITPEILGYGIGAPSQMGACSTNDPSPNAILRLERLADDSGVSPTTCPLTANGRAIVATDYWPNALFDSREAWTRGAAPASSNVKLGGVMYYVAIDAGNLAKWFAGQGVYTVASGATGTLSKTDNAGYSIYISDRRSNRNLTNNETGEWGWEDFVNPASANGTPNGVLDAGEDVNASGTLDTYGGQASCNGAYNTFSNNGITCTDTFYPTLGLAAINPYLDLASTAAGIADTAGVSGAARAETNRAIMFRRAIKLINGDTLVNSVTGFTVATENPVYILGNWNSNGANFSNAHAATAVLADAVTILSSAWDDPSSFIFPYTPGGSSNNVSRLRATQSYYRVAVLSGKGALFPFPAGAPDSDFGSDGGAHNFLRMLEGSPGSDTVNYMGSMASLFYNRQAVGTYKGTITYGVPTRAFQFDTDFLTPSLLPPLTPMFRDNDAVGFSQQLAPGK